MEETNKPYQQFADLLSRAVYRIKELSLTSQTPLSVRGVETEIGKAIGKSGRAVIEGERSGQKKGEFVERFIAGQLIPMNNSEPIYTPSPISIGAFGVASLMPGMMNGMPDQLWGLAFILGAWVFSSTIRSWFKPFFVQNEEAQIHRPFLAESDNNVSGAITLPKVRWTARKFLKQA